MAARKLPVLKSRQSCAASSSSVSGSPRARLEEFGARSWSELAGVQLAWAHGRTWLALGAWFVVSPCSIEELSEALRSSHAELDSEAGFEVAAFLG